MPDLKIQPAGFLLELSNDWLIQAASANCHTFLGDYPQRLVGNPLADFALAQPLHDLRNSLSRQRGPAGIARAYRVKLVDSPRLFDVAFQSTEKALLLEGLPSPAFGTGDALGSVGRLVDGLRGGDTKALLENAARRMRALTGFDRVTAQIAGHHVVSSRVQWPELANAGDLPAIVGDVAVESVDIFANGRHGGTAVGLALLRAPTDAQRKALRDCGMAAVMRVKVVQHGETIGDFTCESRLNREPSFETHAAAEMFAQIVGMLV